MLEFHGVQVCVNDVTQGAADIKFPLAAAALGTRVIGLHYASNGANKHLMSLMEKSIQFPVTIDMPCGWSVTVPTIQSTYQSIACPCGSGLHWIVKWDNKYQ